MKAAVEDLSSVKKKIQIEIPEDEVVREVDLAYRELQKKAKIKGFRPGKVPRSILEQHFKDYVKVEVIQKLIEATYPTALTETKLHPVSNPVIDHGEVEAKKPFQYSAIIEVKPELKMEGYLGLNLEGRKEEAREEDVEERLKALQNLHANLKTITEPRPIRQGDYVILDYEARLDDKSLAEGKGIDFTVEVGGGRFIPALEEKLVGLTPEEEKDIDVSFPEDYGFKKWAGKTISFHVKIKEIKEKVLPALDDEFAKDLGDYSSLADLKAKLKTDLDREKEMAFQKQLKDQIVDRLIEANPLEIPESLVEEQTKALASDTKLKLAAQGVDLKNLNISDEKLQEDYRETAKKQVWTYLMLEKIADQEGIQVTDEEVEGRLREISERSQQKFDAVKRYYEKNGLIPEVKAGLLSDKTLNLLLEKAHVTNG